MKKSDVLFWLRTLQRDEKSEEIQKALDIAYCAVRNTNIAECYICHELTTKPKEDDYGTEYCEKCFKKEGLE